MPSIELNVHVLLWFAEESKRADIVEAERKRLLQKAAELKGFLPKGVLQKPEDLDYINNVLSSKMQRM